MKTGDGNGVRPLQGFNLLSAGGEPAPAELAQRLAAAGDLLRTRRGQLVVAAGTRSRDVYVVMSGRIRFSMFSSDGKEVTMRDQSAGSLFGELSAIDEGRRSVSVVALDDSELLSINAAQFRAAIYADEAAMAWFAGHLTHTIRALTDRVFELSTLNVRSRLHCQLLRLAALAGVEDNRALIAPAPTHEVLATMIGTHREAITRELSWLASAQIVKPGRLKLEILDVERLADMVRRASG